MAGHSQRTARAAPRRLGPAGSSGSGDIGSMLNVRTLGSIRSRSVFCSNDLNSRKNRTGVGVSTRKSRFLPGCGRTRPISASRHYRKPRRLRSQVHRRLEISSVDIPSIVRRAVVNDRLRTPKASRAGISRREGTILSKLLTWLMPSCRLKRLAFNASKATA